MSEKLKLGPAYWGGKIQDNRFSQFSSVAQSCPTLCDPMNCSMPGLPVYHQLPEFTQTHVHRVGDAIQPSHPCRPLYVLPSIFPSFWPFQWVGSLCQVASTGTSACFPLAFCISVVRGSVQFSCSVMPNHLISVVPFFSCLQPFPASGSFEVSQFFTSGGQSIGVSVLPVNI